MVTLKLLLLCLFTITPANQSNPMSGWLEQGAASMVDGTYSKTNETITFDLVLDQSFSGEIALLDQPESSIYQAHHELSAGTNTLDLRISKIHGGQYLLLLHDFEQRKLQTIALIVP